MGQSTDAILAYGYVWDEEIEDGEFATEEARGFWHDEPVQIGWHCSCDYAMPYVYITKSKTLASRGCPETVDLAELVVVDRDDQALTAPIGWTQHLLDFCEKYGIDVGDKQPGWFLCSMWG